MAFGIDEKQLRSEELRNIAAQVLCLGVSLVIQVIKLGGYVLHLPIKNISSNGPVVMLYFNIFPCLEGLSSIHSGGYFLRAASRLVAD